jgi:hypothetical protein
MPDRLPGLLRAVRPRIAGGALAALLVVLCVVAARYYVAAPEVAAFHFALPGRRT